MNTDIMVSVCMITYNHEQFISEAIEGVLMQKTNFCFELIIGEDFSTDNTRVICEDYERKYPDIIKLLPSKNNLGMNANAIRTLKACNGKYIALCEGDDYWTDPYKLQKQVNFLEKNIEFSICFHDVDIVFDDNIEERFKDNDYYQIQYENDKVVFGFDDLLENGNLMHTPSVVFRTPDFWPEFNSYTGDYFLHLHNAFFGKVNRIKQKMAIYRVHSGGVFSLKPNWNHEKYLCYFKKQASAYTILKKEYCKTKKQRKIVNKRLLSFINNARIYSLLNNDFKSSRIYGLKQIDLLFRIDICKKMTFDVFGSIILSIICPKLFSYRVKKRFLNK